MNAILFSHIFCVNNWLEVSRRILSKSTHESTALHFAFLPKHFFTRLPKAILFARSVKGRKRLLFSVNRSQLSEVQGFEKLRRSVDLAGFDGLTWTHAKGVTRPDNHHVRDWVDMMTYFHLERRDLWERRFQEGHSLYGAFLSPNGQSQESTGVRALSPYHYSGNFVTVNLQHLRNSVLTHPCPQEYFGVEAFWGNLCPLSAAWDEHPFPPGFNPYNAPYPRSNYVSSHS